MTKDFDERNAEKSRAVCEAMDRENGRRNLSERERRILDMWPKFEDREYVWFGDEVDGLSGGIDNIDLFERATNFYDMFASHIHLSVDERVNRPEPKVLDADLVEIKVGDTVWHEDGSEWIVEEMNRYGARCFDGDRRRTFDPRCLTHTSPDSWERLEEDVNTIVTGSGMYRRLNDYCNKRDLGGDDVMVLTVCDIVRRAKKLAGVEVGQ